MVVQNTLSGPINQPALPPPANQNQSVEQQALNGGGVNNKQQVSNFMNALNRTGQGATNGMMNSAPPPQQQFQPLVAQNLMQSNGMTSNGMITPNIMQQGGMTPGGTNMQGSNMPGYYAQQSAGVPGSFSAGGQGVAGVAGGQGSVGNAGSTGATTAYGGMTDSSPLTDTSATANTFMPNQNNANNNILYNAPNTVPTVGGGTVTQAPGVGSAYSPNNAGTGSFSPANLGQSTDPPIYAVPTDQADPASAWAAAEAAAAAAANPSQDPNLRVNPFDQQAPPPPVIQQSTHVTPYNNNGYSHLTFSDENVKTSITPAKSEVQNFLDKIHAHSYEYKDKQDGVGTFTTPMAQELERSELGKQAVIDTPRGKMVDYGRLGGVNLAAVSVVHRETQKLQKQVDELRKMFKGKK